MQQSNYQVNLISRAFIGQFIYKIVLSKGFNLSLCPWLALTEWDLIWKENMRSFIFDAEL